MIFDSSPVAHCHVGQRCTRWSPATTNSSGVNTPVSRNFDSCNTTEVPLVTRKETAALMTQLIVLRASVLYAVKPVTRILMNGNIRGGRSGADGGANGGTAAKRHGACCSCLTPISLVALLLTRSGHTL